MGYIWNAFLKERNGSVKVSGNVYDDKAHEPCYVTKDDQEILKWCYFY